MNDTELLEKLKLKFTEAAEIVNVSKQAMNREVKKGVETGKPYLNADRLISLWKHFSDKKDFLKADTVRDVVHERHQGIAALIAPYSSRHPVAGFNFEEGWIFSSNPLELQFPKFRQSMKEFLNSEKHRLVYFVPTSKIAETLKSMLTTTCGSELTNAFIVVTSAVYLCPHWFVMFAPDDKITAGVMPDLVIDSGEEVEIVHVRHTYFENVRDTLIRAKLLDENDRFRLPLEQPAQFEGDPEFSIFYPKVAERSDQKNRRKDNDYPA